MKKFAEYPEWAQVVYRLMEEEDPHVFDNVENPLFLILMRVAKDLSEV